MRHIAGMNDTPEAALSADPAAMTARAREVIGLNIEALQALESSLDDSLARACEIYAERNRSWPSFHDSQS